MFMVHVPLWEVDILILANKVVFYSHSLTPICAVGLTEYITLLKILLQFIFIVET